ncbi:MAG: efflux RND transporter periplasmic adaptor subunit [Rivularia sp. (in: Bacteria)]|nr:efflux RND transporter periplasmic adaptor subunit [Rivularia sp. MS3]
MPFTAKPVILSQMKPSDTHEGMNHGAVPDNNLLTHTALLGGGIFLVGLLVILGKSLFKRSRKEDKKTVESSLRPGKTLLGIGIFVLLAGGIVTVTNQLKPASSMAGMEGHDMSGMSHDDMMQVNGSFNPTPVTIKTVKPSLLSASVQYTGSIHPYQEVTVYPRIAGQLTNYSVYPGDKVSSGQALATLDAAEKITQVAEAAFSADSMESDLVASQIEVNEQRQEIARLKAELEYQEKKRDRYALLVKEGAISQDQYDIEDTKTQTAQAALKTAQVKLRRLEAQVRSARSNVKQARAKSATASVMKGYTKIQSPIAGIVQERMADPGVVVQPSMGILKIGDYQRVRLRANVSQRDAAKIRVGTPIIAKVPGSNVKEITGRVTSIFPQTNNDTRTVTIEAVVNNPGNQLLSGQFLEMQIIAERQANALTVPQSALTQFKDKTAVWVVDGETALRKIVTTGLVSGEQVEITNGLNPGDMVITSGHSRLIENQKVSVVDESGETLAKRNNTSQGNAQIKLISPQNKNSVKKGSAQLILEILDKKTNKPLPVENLDVKVTMPMKNMAPMTSMVDIQPDSQPGRFKVDTHFGMKGKWDVVVKVKDSKHQGKADFNFNVE